MNSSDFGNLLKCYPWDISRRINANPSIAPICNVSGVSFDWEFLISSSFVDCKVIIQDWLLTRRSTLRPDEDTFSDLQIPPVDQEFKRKILARTVLFEQNKYYDMLAMAYLYFAGIYEEETDLLAAFCAQKQTQDVQGDRQRSAADTNGLAPVRFPDWPTLARWLKECVADVHRSAPAWAGGLAQSRFVPSTGAPAPTTATTGRMYAGHGPSSYGGNRPGGMLVGPSGGTGGPGPSSHSSQGLKRQREADQQATGDGSEEEDGSDGEDAEERERKRERARYLHLDHQNLQLQYQRQQQQLQQHRQQQQQQAMAQQQQRPPFPSAGAYGANGTNGQARPFLTTNAAAAYQNATQKHAQRAAQIHQLQQQQQQQQQHNLAFPSLYRQPPHPSAGGASGPHFPPQQSQHGGGGGDHFAAEMPAWLAPFSTNKERVMNLPRDSVFNYRPPPHSSFAPQSGAGAGAEDSQYPAPPQLTNSGRGPQVGGATGSSQSQSNGHIQPASAARTSSTSSSLSGAPANGDANMTSSGSNGSSGGHNGSAAPQNGALKDHFYPVPYIGPVSEHNLLGNMPPSQQESDLKRHNPSQQQLLGQQMYKPSSVASGLSSLHHHPANSALTQQLLLQQQQLQSQQTSQQLAVNRRQKKNRDKFKVTFMLSPAKAAELQRTHGLLPDAPINPSIATIGGILNSNFASTQPSKDNAVPPAHTSSNGNGKGPVKEKDVPFSVLVPLKGIDVLANGRYRVQLNTFMSGRKKFSRNSTDLYEALWIFEIALLISDTPLLLSELQRIGNYNCLAPLGHLGFFCSPREYYLELGRHILLFYDTVDFFNEDLITIAIQNYNAMRPAVAVIPPGMQNLQQQLLQKQSQASGLPLALPLPVSTSGTAGGGAVVEDGSSVGAGSETDEEDRLYNSLLTSNTTSTGPTTNGASAGKEVVPAISNATSTSNITSRAEEAVELPWMGGFAFGLCLLEQQLSCLVCLRALPQPKYLPRISMVKEEKFTAAQIHHQLQQQQLNTGASAGGTGTAAPGVGASGSASVGLAGTNGKHAPFSLVNPSHLN